MKQGRLNRIVTQQECPWLNHDCEEGTPVAEYEGCTYGCITDEGIAVTFENDSCFYEIPMDAIAWEESK